MPELENVVPQKTAGFVDMSYTQARKKARMDADEKELEALIKAQRGETDEEDQTEEPDGEGLDATQVQTKGRAKQEEDDSEGEASEGDDEELTAEEKSFKKRYGDLRRHSAKKEKELLERIEALEKAREGDPKGIRPPKSDEDIEDWASKYPDVAAIVETIATKKAQEMFSRAESRLEEFDKVQYEAQRTKAENAIRKAHADFDELRASDEFHNWAEEQPKWVQDALYENSDDPASVIRVIDLYKVDMGKTPSDYKKKAKDAAKAVARGSRTKVDADSSEGSFKESQVAKMSSKEYEANMEAIDNAIRSGKFIYDLSGGAR